MLVGPAPTPAPIHSAYTLGSTLCTAFAAVRMSAHVLGTHGILMPAFSNIVLLKTRPESLLPALTAYTLPPMVLIAFPPAGNPVQNAGAEAPSTSLFSDAR